MFNINNLLSKHKATQGLKACAFVVGTIFLLIGLGVGYALGGLSHKQQDYKLLHIRNENRTTSFVRTMDLNNDGIDEIIYQPRSLSWYNKTYILKMGDDKNLFVPFCDNCQFETYSSSPEFEDLNNDGLIDIRLPKIVNAADNYKTETNVIYLFNGKDYARQGVK